MEVVVSSAQKPLISNFVFSIIYYNFSFDQYLANDLNLNIEMFIHNNILNLLPLYNHPLNFLLGNIAHNFLHMPVSQFIQMWELRKLSI